MTKELEFHLAEVISERIRTALVRSVLKQAAEHPDH